MLLIFLKYNANDVLLIFNIIVKRELLTFTYKNG